MTKAYKALEKSVHYSMAYSGFFNVATYFALYYSLKQKRISG